jgi:hypothetical protein
MSAMGKFAIPTDAAGGHMLGRRAGLLALGLCVLAGWLIQHPYADITHDGIIYSLLALARLAPDTLGTDVFLRFGSQDRFTVFSPIYALAIRHCDLAVTAALITFVSQMALYGCAWLLARRFMSPASALLAIGLLAVLPGWYASGHLFSYSEDFLTPRLPAEALVLGSLAAVLSHRPRWAIACISAALVVHPIMACAGIAMLSITFIGAPRPKSALLVSAVLLAIALGTALLMPAGPFARFDSEWLGMIFQRTSYVFVSHWDFDDWGRLGVSLSVLSVGWLLGKQPLVRTVCAGAIVTAVSGIALSFLWSDVLHAVLPTQMQFWRWIWIAAVLAVLLSPVIAADCWNSAFLGRAALVLIGCAWLLRTDSGAAFAGLAAVAAAAATRHSFSHLGDGQGILVGSCVLLAVALLINVGDGGSWGLLFAALLAIAWWLQHVLRSTRTLYAFAAALVLGCLAASPAAIRSWTHLHYTPTLRAAFDGWRSQLPANAEVLWPESPVGVWYLLDRPSYWSRPQMAGPIFSRPATLTLDRRTAAIRTALFASRVFRKDASSVTRLRNWLPATLESLDPTGLAVACADPDLGYVVSGLRLGPISLPPIAPDATRPTRQLYIYDCKDFRG